jgi:hypothetical protein
MSWKLLRCGHEGAVGVVVARDADLGVEVVRCPKADAAVDGGEATHRHVGVVGEDLERPAVGKKIGESSVMVGAREAKKNCARYFCTSAETVKLFARAILSIFIAPLPHLCKKISSRWFSIRGVICKGTSKDRGAED